MERYKKNLDILIARGERLYLAMQRECFPDEFDRTIKKQFGDKAKSIKAFLIYKTSRFQPAADAQGVRLHPSTSYPPRTPEHSTGAIPGDR
ncbi:MAG: hypothetical protein N2378_14335 [Chloroflexaceae bacterium]|nr:hypothetical protein [Chloroflexaceae bacterium]